MKIRYRVYVEGMVQGVGFRPFVYQLAQVWKISGYVVNTTQGVEMEVEGEEEAVEGFLKALRESPPPLARITAWQKVALPLRDGERGFRIRESRVQEKRSALISPDTATCDACLRELWDPQDRRYRYPFINCTHCGPRYTIIRDIPYDRPQTTMASFTMCAECAAEYHSPTDRRFHAQPNACPKCGPRVFLHDGQGRALDSPDPVGEAARLLQEGRILAVKGLGGFHLAVDAVQEGAVKRLRSRKGREEKPLALMARDVAAVQVFAQVDEGERRILESRERPIVLLRKKEPNPIAPSVAPTNRYFGVMLPYTPLHHLLLDYGFVALVMTSGNLSEEPICRENEEAFRRLQGIADFFLVHNRDIYLRSDDSIVQRVGQKMRVLRRSRGFVPVPIFLPETLQPVLACGAELKSTVCLTKENRAFLSQHIGDLENLETLEFFHQTVEHLKRILEIEPTIIAHDLHPDYLSTRFALGQEGVRLIGVPHHFAHMVSCMAEHGLQEKVIGLSLDGTGYGTDGCLWGGEILVGDLASFERKGHWEYLPMPGGARAIKEPWRMAISYLYQAYGPDYGHLDLPVIHRCPKGQREILEGMIRRRINSPLTSSCGRFFDGVAALIGLRETVSFEGQAAMELEMIQEPTETALYPFEVATEKGLYLIRPAPIIRAVVEDLQKGVTTARISRRFHLTLMEVLTRICLSLREERGIEKVVLSGGVFQNRTLLAGMEERLQRQGFQVYGQIQVPTNDGGIALGQAVVAHHWDLRWGKGK